MIKGLKAEDIKKAFFLISRVVFDSPEGCQGLAEIRL